MNIQSNMSRRDLLLCAGGVSVLSLGAMVDRWVNHSDHDPEAMRLAAARLDSIPHTLGMWTSTAGEIDPHERRVANIVGGFRRDYQHRETGYLVTMTVLSGAAGPMCVHPPTTCFQGVGYTLSAGPSPVSLKAHDGSMVTLNRAVFSRSEQSLADQVRVFWGWSVDGEWDAPANPRITYRGQSSLYKIYIVDRIPEGSQPIPQAEAFLADAVPVLRTTLAGAAAGSQQQSSVTFHSKNRIAAERHEN